MRVGCLGNIPFEVSDRRIRTISNFSLSGSASYALHQRAGGKDLPELTGIGLDTATIEMHISSYLGVNPRNEVKKLRKAKNSGRVMRLVIGNDYYGKYVITDFQETAIAYDRKAGVSVATLSVNLMEYAG
jgi:hypothetical protein